jgi:hypothetical protein
MNELTREELLTHLDYIKSQLSEINAYLAQQNGRLRTSEIQVAVLQERNPGRSAATWGASAGAIAAAVAEIIRMML